MLNHLLLKDCGKAIKTFSMIFLLMAPFLYLLDCAPTTKVTDWPDIKKEHKPWTRWWWQGSIVTEKGLTSCLESYQKAGLGGVELTPIYGVKGYENQFIDYLSPKWMDMLEFTVKEANRLDLGVDMATGTGWPFGGPWIDAENACRNIEYTVYELNGGEKLDEMVRFMQKPEVHTVGGRIDMEDLVESPTIHKKIYPMALAQVKFEKECPLITLIAYSDKGDITDITNKVDEKGRLDWVAPQGHWKLYALFLAWHGKQVERAAPGGEGNVIDHFSQTALDHYFAKFDSAFTGFKKPLVRAFFNDSYEVDDAAGESNWTQNFFQEFQTRRGYDLRHHLPALFGSDHDEKNNRILCDYRETISDLLLEKFTIRWQRWAQKQGSLIRNQSHGSPANILDLYAASDIPETEGDNHVNAKFASSAAHVTGKNLVSSESATWLNEHFQATLAETKAVMDHFFLAGVNHVFYHGTPYSPPDEKWPGWLFYASVHFGPTNSFWMDFATLNHYVARCQSFLQKGQPDNDILLYFPIYDRWSQPMPRGLLDHFHGPERRLPRWMQQPQEPDLAEQLVKKGFAFDFISDRQLQQTSCQVNNVKIGDLLYKTVLLPSCEYIPLQTWNKVLKLAEKGATVVVHRNLPKEVPGWKELEIRRQQFAQTLETLKFESIKPGVQEAKLGRGKVILGSEIESIMRRAKISREHMVDRGLQYIRRRDANGAFYFVANKSSQPVSDWISFSENAKTAILFDPMNDQSGIAAIQNTIEEGINVFLQLNPGQSCLIRFVDKDIKAPQWPYIKPQDDAKHINGQWQITFIKGGPTLPADISTGSLQSWTDLGDESTKSFSGTARYSITLPKPTQDAPYWILDLGQVKESARVTLNGQEIGTLITFPYRIVLENSMLKNENKLEIDVSNLMANRIADMDRKGIEWKIFHNVNFPARRRENVKDGLFHAGHWQPMPSGLLGPVRLIPCQEFKPD